jgi:tRNA pseudouridine55 synthase
VDGVLNINKPSGPTSHDIVAKIRRILGEKRVGHAGTLDPLATGVLVVCVGKATRIVEYLVATRKDYLAEMLLGRTSTTEDISGEMTSTADASHITRDMVQAVLPNFTGPILQIPPMVSAIKVNGQRLYKLARRDIEVEREARPVTIHELEITSFDPAGGADGAPLVGLRVVCSSGTYIRTLCSDIGAALGVGGLMQSLERTKVGNFGLEDAVSLQTLEESAAAGDGARYLLPMDDAISHFAAMTVDPIQADLIMHGGSIPSSGMEMDGVLVRVKSTDGRLLALGRSHGQAGASIITPEKVFAEAGG